MDDARDKRVNPVVDRRRTVDIEEIWAIRQCNMVRLEWNSRNELSQLVWKGGQWVILTLSGKQEQVVRPAYEVFQAVCRNLDGCRPFANGGGGYRYGWRSYGL